MSYFSSNKEIHQSQGRFPNVQQSKWPKTGSNFSFIYCLFIFQLGDDKEL